LAIVIRRKSPIRKLMRSVVGALASTQYMGWHYVSYSSWGIAAAVSQVCTPIFFLGVGFSPLACPETPWIVTERKGGSFGGTREAPLPKIAPRLSRYRLERSAQNAWTRDGRNASSVASSVHKQKHDVSSQATTLGSTAFCGSLRCVSHQPWNVFCSCFSCGRSTRLNRQ
jgi:hypothetical protein